MPLRAGVVHLLVFLVALDPVAPIAAQQADSSEQKTVFVGSDIVWLGAFTLGSYGLSRVDPRITQYFQQPRHQGSGKLRGVAEAFTRVQETTLTIGGVVTYGIARWAGGKDVQDIALHATEAIVAASLTSQVIRGPLGRARPKDATPKFEDQYEFHWFNGFRNFEYRAYPSIHSSSAHECRDLRAHRGLLEGHIDVCGRAVQVVQCSAAGREQPWTASSAPDGKPC